MIKNKELYNRFLKYVSFDTQSSETSDTHPSTEKQFRLAEYLLQELQNMGISCEMDRQHCYVYGFLPGTGNLESTEPLGFISHMDTSPACSGADVKPRLIADYQGNDPLLKESDFPELKQHHGEDLIATDGTTLLGADDKAGLSEIVTMLSHLIRHPEIPHCPVAVCFTPDEEIGRGTADFRMEKFHARRAYTVDGGKLGEVEYECFNAAAAKVTVSGVSVHPGSAKDTMKNACTLAMEFASMMPPAEVPEHTEGREGFYFLDAVSGDVEKTVLDYIIRDHDAGKFESRKKYLLSVTDYLNRKYGAGTFSTEIRDQYHNMYEVMKDHMDLVEKPLQLLKESGVTPITSPIRGGTDGAVLCFRGIPCPNLCTGGYNYHSRFEYASVQEMEAVTDLLIRLTEGA